MDASTTQDRIKAFMQDIQMITTQKRNFFVKAYLETPDDIKRLREINDDLRQTVRRIEQSMPKKDGRVWAWAKKVLSYASKEANGIRIED